MNILFLTIGEAEAIENKGIEAKGVYTDLLRKFRDEGHNVFIVCSREKRTGKPTAYDSIDGVNVLRVRTGNLTQCGLIEKGISTVCIESRYKAAIKRYMRGVKFDMVLYSTPPITFVNVVKYIKKRDKAYTYLLLKDIFPQNAVDLGMLKKSGIKGIIYSFFRAKEKKLYAVSDKIGCMSPANCAYVAEHNPGVDRTKIEVSPNTLEPCDMRKTPEEKNRIRMKYGIPTDKKVLIYGGNLGKPQGIPQMLECLKTRTGKNEFYVIAGSGTEANLIEDYISECAPDNIRYIRQLPRDEYEELSSACDAGLIFLDPRFTIPNFPSRILSYMQSGLPVIACTDRSTDIGKTAQDKGFGFSCFSSEPESFSGAVDLLLKSNIEEMGNSAFSYLKDNYSSDESYKIIISAFSERLSDL